MKRTVVEEIYIIFNLAAQKQYVGKTRNLDSRYSAHVSKLRSGKHDIPDLQRDWDRAGEDNFIWVDVLRRAGQMGPNILEDLLIDTLRSTDPTLGYNRMTSRGWSSHAGLRDLEHKLIRRGKFKLIPGVKLDDPIAQVYLEAVWQEHDKKKRERPEWKESEEQWDALEEQEEGGDEGERPEHSYKSERQEEDALQDGEEGDAEEDEDEEGQL